MTRSEEAADNETADLALGEVSCHEERKVIDWRILKTAPGAVAEPSALAPAADGGWMALDVPGTVASHFAARYRDEGSISETGTGEAVLSLEAHSDYDAADWWYHGHFKSTAESARVMLRLEGLATLAQVWLNGQLQLTSENMFLAQRVDVTAVIKQDNDIVIAFRSLAHALKEKRPRPRYKTALVQQQRLRWFRTCLLGRITGWSPAVKVVGAWRPIALEAVRCIDVRSWRLVCGAKDGIAKITFNAQMHVLDSDWEPRRASMQVGEHHYPVGMHMSGNELSLALDCFLLGVALWFPHTHGEPVRHHCILQLEAATGTVEVDLGQLGFREVSVDREAGDVRFRINDVEVFCRGGCWLHHDMVGLCDSALRKALVQVRDSGANMLRVSGTSVYPSRQFYELCDELGVMVWQDFMFANMDYPTADDTFVATVEREIVQRLSALGRHCSVVTYCGNSEAQQQAAMRGAPVEVYRNEFFETRVLALVTQHHPDVGYFPSSPCGEGLPFHVGNGVAHYFGVGAYRQPLASVRSANVRFAAECLAFSNVPEPETMKLLSDAGASQFHHPAWKRGVPRDAGAGWDFEDVRDHYLHALTGLDAVALRCEDPGRYLELSRVVTGWVMRRVYDEWRSADSRCAGGLVWFFQDLRPGAGWGVVDATGRPKAAYFFLRRAWAPIVVSLLDRDLDGLLASLVNDSPAVLRGTLQVAVFANGALITASAERAIEVPSHGVQTVQVSELLGRFHDLTHSYKFGPRKYESVMARLLDDRGVVLSEHVYRLVPGREAAAAAAALTWQLTVDDEEQLILELSCSQLIYDLRIDVRDYQPDDNYFVLTPGHVRQVRLRRISQGGRRFRGFIEASNMAEAVRLKLPSVL